jgi:hypothetical protein
MLQPTTLLRSLGGSLGNSGAVDNVRRVLEARQREEWVVDSLLRRLAPVTTPTLPTAPPAPGRPARAA